MICTYNIYTHICTHIYIHHTGSKDSIYNQLKIELDNIALENWLRVIPQLIARMHVKSSKIAELLRKLLIRLAAAHPQALVCPISVALNTGLFVVYIVCIYGV